MTRLLFALVAVLATGCCTSRHGQRMTESPANNAGMQIPFKIGNTVVVAEVFKRGKAVPTMINVHDDESTSVAAGKLVIEQTNGRLIELSHGGRRNVRFALHGQEYSFDPNRIFSDEGIRDTLERRSTWTEAAHRATKRFASQLVEHFDLDDEKAIIALHNNSEGDLSIQSYLPGGEHADTSTTVHVAPHRSPDDFFYVTDKRFFDYLKQHDFNVTLQDNANVPDDGSLSVYFGKKGIPYVNVEAESSHLNAQIEMVRVVHQMLDELILNAHR